MRELTIAIYVLCALALVLVEVLARRTRLRIPTLGQLFRWMLRRRSAQLGVVMAWWWIGWHFLGSA